MKLTPDYIVPPARATVGIIDGTPAEILTLGDLEHIVRRLHPAGCATCNRIGPELIAAWAETRGRP